MTDPAPEKKRLPPWLVGLIIAVVVGLLGLIVFQALGFGDNPVLESMALSLGDSR